MRTITPEYTQWLEENCPAYATIIHTPPPDFTELHRLSMEFEEWLGKEQEKDRKRIREALKNDR